MPSGHFFTMRSIITLILTLSTLLSYSQETARVPDHPDKDFVLADVLVISEGSDFISCMGHAALRLQCPTHNLDYVFDVTAEDFTSNFLCFVKGEQVNTTNITPSDEFIARYAAEGRSVIAYRLDLPIATKQRLWEIMDNHVAEKPRPFTRMHESCSGSIFRWLKEAAGDSLQVATWPKQFECSIYEMADRNYEHSWKRVIIATLAQGNIIDAGIPNIEKIITPSILEDVLKATTAYGHPIISRTKILEPKTVDDKVGLFSPANVAFLLFALSLLNLRIGSNCLSMAVLAFPLQIGLIVTLLVAVSRIESMTFNWLMIPFSPLPWLFYKFRRYWLWAMSAVCLIWSAAMLAVDHKMIINTHIILALATAFAYAQLVYSNKREKTTLNE